MLLKERTFWLWKSAFGKSSIALSLRRSAVPMRCCINIIISDSLLVMLYSPYEIQSTAGKPPQNLVAPHRRRGADRFAPGGTDRVQTSPYLQFPQPQTWLEPGRHGQGLARATPFRARSAGSRRGQQARQHPAAERGRVRKCPARRRRYRCHRASGHEHECEGDSQVQEEFPA